MSLARKAFHAFKWSILGEIASKAIGPLVFLVLARLLVPEDFGVIAALWSLSVSLRYFRMPG